MIFPSSTFALLSLLSVVKAATPTTTSTTTSTEPLVEKRQLGGGAPGQAAYLASLSAGPSTRCTAGGTACPPQIGAEMVTCVNSICKPTVCLAGSSIAANGFCATTVAATCSAGYTLNTLTGTCAAQASGLAINCAIGYTYNAITGFCVDTQHDPNNCGFIGNICKITEPFGVAGCIDGACTIVKCILPYILCQGKCQLFPSQAARARAKAKRQANTKSDLCPMQETACPIADSKAFFIAQINDFADYRSNDTSALYKRGGYECLDTTQSLESCGGCASMGEGMNCLKIAKAVGVGCQEAKCTVLSCEAGFRPNAFATKCLREVTAATHRRARLARGLGLHHKTS